MSVLGFVLATALAGSPPPEPVLWLSPKGTLLVEGKPAQARLTTGAKTVRTPFGLGLDLDGTHGGLLVADRATLALTRSLTVSTWIYLRSYVNDGPGAQILFRGDDRSGYDPYALAILGDGTVQFGVGGGDGNGADVRGEIPLRRWVHVTASLDGGTGELRLWLGERLVATRTTERRPYADLDGGQAPGLGIGNVQNDGGPHNQPLNGVLADLRLYGAALEPSELGVREFRETP